MHVHSLKHNAKASAKRVAARVAGLEVVEPVKAMPLPGTATDGWYASLRLADGFALASVPLDVRDSCHIEVPPKADALVYESTGDDVRGVQYADGDEVVDEADPVDLALEKVTAPKEKAVFALIRRAEGATVFEIAGSMGWLKHTTRSFVSTKSRKWGLESYTEKVDGRGNVYRLRMPSVQVEAE